MSINEFAERCMEMRKQSGFKTTKENMEGKLLRVISEISEASELIRDDNWTSWYEEDGKPEGFIFELADAMIRIGDIAASLGYDLEVAIAEKLLYNSKRPYLHGRQSTV